MNMSNRPQTIQIFLPDGVSSPFGSPSTAAATVLGRRANGWMEWKNKEGVNIDQLFRNTSKA